MPRFYCDYCDVYLTHDSFAGRKQHMRGRKHQDNVRQYFMQFLKKPVLPNFRAGLVPIRGGLRPTNLIPFNRRVVPIGAAAAALRTPIANKPIPLNRRRQGYTSNFMQPQQFGVAQRPVPTQTAGKNIGDVLKEVNVFVQRQSFFVKIHCSGFLYASLFFLFVF